MNPKSKNFLVVIIAFLIGMFVMHLLKSYKIEKRDSGISTTESRSPVSQNNRNNSGSPTFQGSSTDIEQLTEENKVIEFVKTNHQLPDFYLTKKEAKDNGWIPSRGNLCDVLPGRAIGGDHFSNREGNLPPGEKYYEADVNCKCGRRDADRIIFTRNGRVWVTHNHYKTFEEK